MNRKQSKHSKSKKQKPVGTITDISRMKYDDFLKRIMRMSAITVVNKQK